MGLAIRKADILASETFIAQFSASAETALKMLGAQSKMLSTLLKGVDNLAPRLICFLPADDFTASSILCLCCAGQNGSQVYPHPLRHSAEAVGTRVLKGGGQSGPPQEDLSGTKDQDKQY